MNAVYAQSKRVENLHLTRERDRRRGRELATLLFVGLPIACAFLVYAALHIETVRIGYTREARACGREHGHGRAFVLGGSTY